MLAAVADGSLVVEAKPVKKRNNPTKPAAGSRKRSTAKGERVVAMAASGASQRSVVSAPRPAGSLPDTSRCLLACSRVPCRQQQGSRWGGS
jgi:hypothetical protein